jgi:hypothetical protein
MIIYHPNSPSLWRLADSAWLIVHYTSHTAPSEHLSGARRSAVRICRLWKYHVPTAIKLREYCLCVLCILSAKNLSFGPPFGVSDA